ncbi:ABC transporter substrate-binding protein [Bradyrhizobium sp. CCBAU 53421]|uniref:ABC transporter substrate-binding protein n=1 Tax=Bradyrhizobium sp. CCBAU 53421 TaxID=1325120 RepID=UPI00188B56FC|nr:ABC transporter substrate-binding protein [Bradyrhizobium sp. CCBAU 53421]QOZ36356.1 oligopeptide ABC transporter substrate-binding protein [Bradyrhizobium sp. CCBAU 53421]
MPGLSRRSLLKAVAVGAAMPPRAFGQSGRPRLVVAVPTQPDYADPVMLNNTPALRMLSNAFDGLLRIDFSDNMTVKPAIAETWRRIDDTSVEFTLRRGVKFHDGSIVTADDVVFSLGKERRLGPSGSGNTIAAQYQQSIASVQARGPHTVLVTTKGPDPAIDKKLAAWSAQIVSEAAFRNAGSWDNWFRAPIGAGAYRVISNQKDVSLVLKSHDDYWGGLPPFDRIEFRIVPELSSRVNGLLAGDYDLISDLLPDQFDSIDASRFDVVGGAIANLRVLAIDTTAPVLSDRRIRQALSLAIDRDLIISQLWRGRIDVPNGAQYPMFGDVYDPAFPVPAHDPDKARALVRQAGYDGDPIAYRLLNNWYPNQVLTAQILVQMWKSVGLNVVLHPMENFSQVYAKPSHAIWDESFLPSWPDPTSMVWRQHAAGGGQHALKIWDSPQYQSVGAAFAQSSDAEQRKELAHRALEILAEDVPFIILHNNGAFYAKRRNLAWAPYSALVMDFGPFNPAARTRQ